MRHTCLSFLSYRIVKTLLEKISILIIFKLSGLSLRPKKFFTPNEYTVLKMPRESPHLTTHPSGIFRILHIIEGTKVILSKLKKFHSSIQVEEKHHKNYSSILQGVGPTPYSTCMACSANKKFRTYGLRKMDT